MIQDLQRMEQRGLVPTDLEAQFPMALMVGHQHLDQEMHMAHLLDMANLVVLGTAHLVNPMSQTPKDQQVMDLIGYMEQKVQDRAYWVQGMDHQEQE